MVLALR